MTVRQMENFMHENTYSHILSIVCTGHVIHMALESWREIERERKRERQRKTATEILTTCSETGREKAREIAKEGRR